MDGTALAIHVRGYMMAVYVDKLKRQRWQMWRQNQRHHFNEREMMERLLEYTIDGEAISVIDMNIDQLCQAKLEMQFCVKNNEGQQADLAQVWVDILDRRISEVKRGVMNITLTELVEECHQIAVEHGFWEGERNDGEYIALMHSELSEALEAMRKIPADGKAIAEELGDCIIRILDFCGAHKLDIEAAVLAKMEVNRGRPWKHGKEF